MTSVKRWPHLMMKIQLYRQVDASKKALTPYTQDDVPTWVKQGCDGADAARSSARRPRRNLGRTSAILVEILPPAARAVPKSATTRACRIKHEAHPGGGGRPLATGP